MLVCYYLASTGLGMRSVMWGVQGGAVSGRRKGLYILCNSK